jgi:hypothetical protein
VIYRKITPANPLEGREYSHILVIVIIVKWYESLSRVSLFISRDEISRQLSDKDTARLTTDVQVRCKVIGLIIGNKNEPVSLRAALL